MASQVTGQPAPLIGKTKAVWAELGNQWYVAVTVTTRAQRTKKSLIMVLSSLGSFDEWVELHAYLFVSRPVFHLG